MTKAIIFDMDGVLVDSEPFHVQIEKQQFLLNQITVTDEEHHQYMGVATDVMWKQLAERHSMNVSVEELTEQNRVESIRFFSAVQEIPVMPGLQEALENLSSKNYPMAVASSSFPEIIKLILHRTGLKNFFKVVVSSQEAGKSKPEPDVFLLAAQKLGVLPADCLVIEDSKNGIKAAHAAGMRCIAYQGQGANPESQKKADAVIKNYSELENLI
jgi:HAD superfamily hydrolase (TIGR01509 family)